MNVLEMQITFRQKNVYNLINYLSSFSMLDSNMFLK